MRDPIDILRVKYWFWGVKAQAGVKTKYALERLLEPEAFGRNEDGDPYHRNKWRGYESGKQTPRQTFVERINLQFPGTQRELNHPFWECLRSNNVQRNTALVHLVEKLEPEFQILLGKVGIWSGHNFTNKKFSSRIFKMLQQRASLDALACSTILLHKAHLSGDSSQLNLAGKATFDILLIMGEHFRLRKISKEIFSLYLNQWLYDLRSHGRRYYFEYYDFEHSALMLEKLLWKIKGVEPHKLTAAEIVKYKDKILRGSYGIDWMFAFLPITGPVQPLSSATKNEIEAFQSALRLHQWRRENIILDKKEKHTLNDLTLGDIKN